MDRTAEIKFLLGLQGNYYTMIDTCDKAIEQGVEKEWWEQHKSKCKAAVTDIRIKISSLKNEGLPPAVGAMNMLLDSVFPSLNLTANGN